MDVYAVPRFTESALLYYRKDLAPAPPRTWQELRQLALAKKRLLFIANPLTTPDRARGGPRLLRAREGRGWKANTA